jgi:hypothetical protein
MYQLGQNYLYRTGFDSIHDNIKGTGLKHGLELQQETEFLKFSVHIFYIPYIVYHQFQSDILSCGMLTIQYYRHRM